MPGMANETQKIGPSFYVAMVIGPMLAVGMGIGYVEWNKHQANEFIKQHDADAQLLMLKAQVRDLEAKLAKQETPAPTPSPTDPAMEAQLASLRAAIVALTDSQKALAAKLAQPAPVTPLIPAAVTPVAPPAIATAPAPVPVAPVPTPPIATARPPVPAVHVANATWRELTAPRRVERTDVTP